MATCYATRAVRDAALKPDRESPGASVFPPGECYVFGTSMRFHRLAKILLTLLLVASLPLRAYAAPCESPATHAAHHVPHCEHGSPAGHAAACDCCCLAVAAALPSWPLTHDPASAVLARLLGYSPLLTLDRLDRPPRLPA
jgi:hypothetical protein